MLNKLLKNIILNNDIIIASRQCGKTSALIELYKDDDVIFVVPNKSNFRDILEMLGKFKRNVITLNEFFTDDYQRKYKNCLSKNFKYVFDEPLYNEKFRKALKNNEVIYHKIINSHEEDIEFLIGSSISNREFTLLNKVKNLKYTVVKYNTDHFFKNNNLEGERIVYLNKILISKKIIS